MMMATSNKSSGSLPDYSTLRGVYIEDVDGYLYTESEWNGSKTPNGVAVITNNCRFVIALEDAYSNYCEWGIYGTVVNYITTTKSTNVAVQDYDGDAQTTAILNQLGDSSSIGAAPAAHYCRAFTFPNGKKGYLGAAGEWQAAIDNKANIESALARCGGAAMSDWYWTSTQYSSATSWEVYWLNSTTSTASRAASNYIRAFASLKFDNKDGSVGLETLYITVPITDGFGKFTEDQIIEIESYCMSFGENYTSKPLGFNLFINGFRVTYIKVETVDGKLTVNGDMGDFDAFALHKSYNDN